MLKRALLLLIPLFFLIGCGEDFIFEKTLTIPNGEWTYEQPLTFDFSIADTSARYDILLDVKHADTYGFQNLYVQFHTTFPSGKKESQTVSLELAKKNGIWNGKCSGEKCEVKIPLQVNAFFPETGAHQIAVEQYMRKNPLPGVEEMTLKIRENKRIRK